MRFDAGSGCIDTAYGMQSDRRWCEDVMPTLGAVVINLREKRSNGKTFGLNIVSEKKGRENETS